MKFNPWVLGGILLSSTTPLLSTNALLATALADSYHAVEPGETLSAIALRYKTSPDALRAANQLSGIADGTALTAMLLRVPSNSEPKAAVSVASTSNANSGYFGSITKSEHYVVQPGDTLETIVARFAQGNRVVTANDIRLKNQLTGQPVVGTTLVVPVKTVYAAQESVASTQPVLTAQAAVRANPRSNSAVEVSEETLPVAQIIPTNQPVYRAPNQTVAPKVEKQAARRGPSVLTSRGRTSSGDMSGVRILGQQEEAASAGTPVPSPKVITTTPAAPTAPARTLAKVAKVALQGARIRRLPDSDAVSLYNCSTGTELAVINQQSGWSSILMSDRSTGWIPSRYLRDTGASVDITDHLKAGTWSSRPTGSSNAYGSGNYSSSHPMVAEALKWLGTPYVYGGEGRRGIDCSALMQNSFRACGYRLPRTAAQQAKVGQKVDPANLQPGDRLYFSASGRRVDHTGLYMGDGMYVHASGSGRRVMVSNLFDRSSWNIFVGARR